MGNSFPHLLDDIGDLSLQRRCIQNFHGMLKPSGTLIIDHRNYDYILKHGISPKKNIYYNSQHIDKISTRIIYENQEPRQIVLNYKMDVEEDGDFTLSYHPYTLEKFSNLITSVFYEKTNYTIYADFKPMAEEPDPAFYIHVIDKEPRKWTSDERR